MLENVVVISGENRTFTLEKAQDVAAIVRRITTEYSEKVEAILAKIDNISQNDSEQATKLEAEADRLFLQWQTKVEKLGGQAKGMWLVDYDFGQGYYCWKYPELRIEYWHKYTDGFSGRQRIIQPDMNN